MSQPHSLESSFTDATSGSGDYYVKIRINIDLFMATLKKYETEESINTPQAEEEIKEKFHQFLKSCGFYMAKSDFDDLLKEIKPRDNGTIGWYHQLSQIMYFLDMVRDAAIPLENLEEYGGLETAIRTALRHDSIEDFGKSFKQFKEMERNKIALVYAELKDQGIDILDDGRLKTEEKNLKILMKNLRLITKKVADLDDNHQPQYHPDGRMKKISLFKSLRDYIHNMIDSQDASPVVWILKTLDGSHNLSTMLGAEKFTAQRRLKYSNERENMYGGRDATPERAMRKWPKFKKAIEKVDNLMGSILYTNMGYLEYVDQNDVYPGDQEKFAYTRTIYQSGISKYLGGTTSFDVPRAFDMFHTFMDRIQNFTEQHESEVMRDRTNFWFENSIKPALKIFAPHFPRIFPPSNGNGGYVPNGSTLSPNFL